LVVPVGVVLYLPAVGVIRLVFYRVSCLPGSLGCGSKEVREHDPPESGVPGIAVHIASRIAALADSNEILVSRTVVELTSGSGLQFVSNGEHELKGVPGTWPVFAAQTRS
jgi:hypothetical protein